MCTKVSSSFSLLPTTCLISHSSSIHTLSVIMTKGPLLRKEKPVVNLFLHGLTRLSPMHHHHQTEQPAQEQAPHLSNLPLLQLVLLTLWQTQSLPIPFKSLKTLSGPMSGRSARSHAFKLKIMGCFQTTMRLPVKSEIEHSLLP